MEISTPLQDIIVKKPRTSVVVTSPATSAVVTAVASAGPLSVGESDQFKHKNRLQEYAQRSSIQLPIYQTINEGFQHAPKFRSTVLIDGMTFSSSETFVHRKDAEQHVAKIALEGINSKIQQEGCPSVYVDAMLCKSILHEYSMKMNLKRPTYTTSLSSIPLPMFVSSILFNGNTYKGIAARNKKQAEQLAAHMAINSILGDSNPSMRILMSEIVKSKKKLYEAAHSVNYSNSFPEMNPSSRESTETLTDDISLDGKQKQMASVNTSSIPIHSVEYVPMHLPDEKNVKEECKNAVSSDLNVKEECTDVLSSDLNVNEECTNALSSDLIESIDAVQHELQPTPPLQQLKMSTQVFSGNVELCGQGENETPVMDKPSPTTGTQRTSSGRKRKGKAR